MKHCLCECIYRFPWSVKLGEIIILKKKNNNNFDEAELGTFVDNISVILANILPCVIEDWKRKSVAEDQRAESPDRKHTVHHTSTDLLNRVKVNEADQLIQAYIYI